MKHAIFIAMLVLLVAVLGAPSASAQKKPCRTLSVQALPRPTTSDGLQFYVMKRCGQRVGLPFG